jgi:hypothetical protein
MNWSPSSRFFESMKSLPNRHGQPAESTLVGPTAGLAQTDATDALASKSLSCEEQTCLQTCEKLIHQDKNAFLLIGRSLDLIRFKKLFRAEYRSFHDYLWKRWNLSEAHGYRLIDASRFSEWIKEISPNGEIKLPYCELHYRLVLKLPENLRLPVLQRASASSVGSEINRDALHAAIAEIAPGKVKKAGRENDSKKANELFLKLAFKLGKIADPEIQGLLEELRAALGMRPEKRLGRSVDFKRSKAEAKS